MQDRDLFLREKQNNFSEEDKFDFHYSKAHLLGDKKMSSGFLLSLVRLGFNYIF